jgi:DNA polymerase-4
VKSGHPIRRILHIDLDPFFVSVERSLNPSLRGQPVVIGSDGSSGIVAAASAEAQAAGVHPGQTIRAARRLCPRASFLAGDFETYARVCLDVTQILLNASPRVERPSADEAFVELSAQKSAPRHPFRIVDGIQDQIHRRLGLDASFGLASTRLAARIASRFAKPRGLLVLLPEHEESFVARQPLEALGEVISTTRLGLLNRAGLRTVNDLRMVDMEKLARLVGPIISSQLKDAVALDGDSSIPVAAPPTTVHEEATIRDSHASRADMEFILENLARRALKRIRPFDLRAMGLTVEVHRVESHDHRAARFRDGISDERTLIGILRNLSESLFATPRSIRRIVIRLGPLSPSPSQYSMFPDLDLIAQNL